MSSSQYHLLISDKPMPRRRIRQTTGDVVIAFALKYEPDHADPLTGPARIRCDMTMRGSFFSDNTLKAMLDALGGQFGHRNVARAVQSWVHEVISLTDEEVPQWARQF